MMSPQPRPRLLAFLAGGVALIAITASAGDNECQGLAGQVGTTCRTRNAGIVVNMPVGANTAPAPQPLRMPAGGFAIAVDGEVIAGDRRISDRAQRADEALADSDVQLTFDGLQLSPRLDVKILDSGGRARTGDPVTLQSTLNYPAFVRRGEFRIIDRAAEGGERTIEVVPVLPNGRATITLPKGDDLVVVHRVYDAQGRYDETVPIELGVRDDRGLSPDAEDGSDATAIRHIPLQGGAVTVYAKNLAPGARIRTLGEEVTAAPGGDLVLQRILPIGTHEVEISGAGRGAITREIVIPEHEWFRVGTADLTFGTRRDDAGRRESYQKGRLAFYLKGRTASGLNITASADTGEADLDTLFRDLDKTDPRSFLLRIDPDDYYPVYGDDSTFEEDAPTSGRFYLRLEKDGNHLLWGNFRNRFEGSAYLHGERALYGLQGHAQTGATTARGDARAQLSFYGASPDHLPQRDVFTGTSGSVYFLQKQDVSIGSEMVSIEIRDPVSGRIVSRQPLTYGRDYDVDYIQGVITLNRPLSGYTSGGVVVGSTDQVNLVVQYEWTPTGSNIDAMSYGGRAEAWVTDHLRVGLTGQYDRGGTADQRALGADIRWEMSDDTYLSFEAARSDGPGYASSRSLDGGLIFDTDPQVAGSGTALRFEGRAGFADLGIGKNGYFGGYFERRDRGFSTFDYQVAANEQLWGLALEADPRKDLHVTLKYDDYRSDNGRSEGKGGVEALWQKTDRLAYTLGVQHLSRQSIYQNGDRTDVALRMTLTESDDLGWYVYGQGTVQRSGLPRNDRIGLGLSTALGRNWTVLGELSQGTSGWGRKILFTRNYGQGESAYFGYELDPDRDPYGNGLTGLDGGKYTFGARRKLTENLSSWGENTYDLFGLSRSLTSAYGVEYSPGKYSTYSLGFDFGRVRDEINGDFDRKGLAFGVRYDDGEWLSASGKAEYRTDRGVGLTAARDSDTFLVKGTVRYKIDEAQRMSLNLEAVKTNGDATALRAGSLVDFSVGYAMRPVRNNRLNILFKYRFLYDMYGQKVDGTDVPGPRQRTHVLSADAEYDLNRYWSIGGKVGFRLTDSAPDVTTPLARNDAWLVVANARYHLVHDWDALVEARMLRLQSARMTDYGFLAALYKQVGNNVEVGVGYNFARFSDDLTDLTMDNKGFFVNLVVKF